MRYIFLGLLPFMLLYRCIDNGPEKAQQIINKAIDVHGGNHFVNAKVSFDFRDMHYTALRSVDSFVYTRTFHLEGDTVRDVLVNSSEFTRLINGDSVSVLDSMKVKYSNSVNSVLYFIQLPILLNDPAVNKKFVGKTSINESSYSVIKVTFDSEGGGEDFEDEYMYWFNDETGKLDYLAYNYQTDGGGVRFREAYNRSTRGGILFQDYINYEAPIGTPLPELPELWEQGELNELSRIVNENISYNKVR